MQFTAEVTPMAMELIFDKSIRDPEVVEISIPVYRARKHHKKKRIRKKWIKRYGVKLEYETYRGKFTENEDGSYGFKGRRRHAAHSRDSF